MPSILFYIVPLDLFSASVTEKFFRWFEVFSLILELVGFTAYFTIRLHFHFFFLSFTKDRQHFIQVKSCINSVLYIFMHPNWKETFYIATSDICSRAYNFSTTRKILCINLNKMQPKHTNFQKPLTFHLLKTEIDAHGSCLLRIHDYIHFGKQIKNKKNQLPHAIVIIYDFIIVQKRSRKKIFDVLHI